MFVSVVHLFYICCACDFMFQLKSERETEWVSIVSLSESGDSCKECSWIHPQRVRWWRLSSWNFILIRLEVVLGYWSRARWVRRQKEGVSVVNLSRGIWRLLQEVRGVRRIQHLESRWTIVAKSGCTNPFEVIKVETLRRFNTLVTLLKENT
jgi:hypothetical protein